MQNQIALSCELSDVRTLAAVAPAPVTADELLLELVGGRLRSTSSRLLRGIDIVMGAQNVESRCVARS